jgi:hypothetical protein
MIEETARNWAVFLEKARPSIQRMGAFPDLAGKVSVN